MNPQALLWLAIAANLGAAALAVVATLRASRFYDRMTRMLNELKARPEYRCVREGHELEVTMETLDDQQLNYIRLTHLFKLSCRRCGFEQVKSWRMALSVEGVEPYEGSGEADA